jgi:hypothetical protein
MSLLSALAAARELQTESVPIIQFKGKTAVESYHRVVPHHTLEIDAKLSLSKKPSLDGNLIIEGDNLIALKSLLPTHAGKIKCIYIYFTETSQNFDASKVDKATGKIGEWKNTSYYLLYSPNHQEDQALDVDFLKKLKDKNPRKVIYCEKVWVHREDLSQFGDIRPMLVPFNLK